jgi:hypothetical protein
MVYERLGVELPGRATPSDTVNDMLSLGGELTLLEK